MTAWVAQQQRVRTRYPHTPVGELKLLPTDRRNPDGRRAITGFSLAFAHRTWVDRMPLLHNADGIEYDKSKIVLYAYRHSYAQRHADAGVPVEVLRELISHRKLETTSGYYRVGETRRREAVDRITAMQFDRHGNRIWRQAQALLDSEHARRAVGEVAVPFGVCAEPSNVKAGGGACPFRFRCAGCDHSAPTSPTCPTSTPTSTTCCAPANACSPPPTSINGHAPKPCPRAKRSAASAD